MTLPIPQIDYASMANNKVIVLCLEGCHGVGKTHVCEQFERYLQSQKLTRDITFLDEAFMAAAAPIQQQQQQQQSSSATAPSSLQSMSPLRQNKQQQQQQQPPQIMHPQSLYSELNWVSNWFKRVMTLKQQHVLHHQHIANQLQQGIIPHDSPQYQESLRMLTQPKLYVVDRSPYSAVFYTRHGRGKTFLPLIRSTIEELKEEGDIHVFTVCLKVSNMDILWHRISERLKREPSRMQFNEASRDWMSHVYDMYDSFEWDFSLTNDSGFEGSSIFDIIAHIEDTLVTGAASALPTAAPGSPISQAAPPSPPMKC